MTASNTRVADLLTLDTALKAHHEWKVRLEETLRNGATLDVETMRKDNCCDLGRWLYSQGGRQYGHVPEFVHLLNKHKDFHSVAGVVATSINNKQTTKAQTALADSKHFAIASREVGVAIVALRNALANCP